MPTSLQFRLQSGAHGIPLRRVHRITGFASLVGEQDDYFLGWLNFHGTAVPVWDLNRVVCDAPTAEQFGARIILLESGWEGSLPLVGLLAAAVTDTCADDDPAVQPLDIDLFLQMLANLLPPAHAEQR